MLDTISAHYFEGLELLNIFYKRVQQPPAKRTPYTVSTCADFEYSRLESILSARSQIITYDETLRLCIFGLLASFDETNQAIGLLIDSSKSLAKRSRQSIIREEGLKRLQHYHDLSGRSLRMVSEFSGGLSAALICKIIHGDRPITRPVLIRLCGFGWGCVLNETNAALVDFSYKPLSTTYRI